MHAVVLETGGVRMLRLLVCIVVLTAGGGLASQEKARVLPPLLMLVGRIDPETDSFTLRATVMENRSVVRTQKSVLNGVESEIQVTKYESVQVPIECYFSMKEWKVITARGRAMLADEAWHKLKTDMAVLLLRSDQIPDPAVLAVLKPDTLVIVPLKK
jgi:hypothetical protein